LVSGTIAFPEVTNFNDLENMKVETWNVLTLKNNHRIDILTHKFGRFKLDFLGVLETHIQEIGSMTLSDIEFFIQAGRIVCIDKKWGS